MWPDAARRNITRENFERFTAGLAPDLRIMDLMDLQPRIHQGDLGLSRHPRERQPPRQGREILAKYKPQFDAVEKAYGVDRYIDRVDLGHRIQLLDADGRPQRAQFHRDAGLRRPPPGLLQGRIPHRARNPQPRRPASRTDARPWAGAFGPTQFMPTAFKRYAVDADGDGRRDVVDNPADLIASTANNLKKDGWQTGRAGATRWCCRRALISCWPTRPRR